MADDEVKEKPPIVPMCPPVRKEMLIEDQGILVNENNRDHNAQLFNDLPNER